MRPDDNSRPQPNPSEIEKLLEIELMQKRADWKQAKARHSTWRLLSFLFLFLIIVAALAVFFIFFTSDRKAALKAGGAGQTQPTPTPLTSPH